MSAYVGILIVVVVLGAFGFLAVRWIMNKARGSMHIELSAPVATAGSQLQGVLHIHLRKPIQAQQVAVRLYAMEEASGTSISFGPRNQNSGPSATEVYKFELPVGGAQLYQGDIALPFSMPIPDISGNVPQQAGGMLGSVLSMAGSFGGMNFGILQWYLEGHMSIDGAPDFLGGKTSIAVTHAQANPGIGQAVS